ncbi:MAG: sigma-70 family RNA polymerase sigma factor [Ruminococcaceae bacterium]|nr:sigma-70 family RNA polymerase sigma factor [Oscillospiraceae bacterium]
MKRKTERVIYMDDKRIIELYNLRDEQAIKETDLKYGRLCTKIADGILKNPPDSEECKNSSYFKLWNSIPPENPISFCGYLCKIVRNTAIEMYRKLSRGKSYDVYEELKDTFTDNDNPEKAYDRVMMIRQLNEFLEKQDKKNRKIFVARYYFGLSHRAIADNFGLTEQAVKSRLLRIKAALKKHLTDSGITI